jgi:hypothetical protein
MATTKRRLLRNFQTHINIHVADQLFNHHDHIISRLPPCVCDCNPHEFGWDELRHVAYLDKNTSHDIKFKKLEEMVFETVGPITAEVQKG